jgi:hypothetical protein
MSRLSMKMVFGMASWASAGGRRWFWAIRACAGMASTPQPRALSQSATLVRSSRYHNSTMSEWSDPAWPRQRHIAVAALVGAPD